ncbi:MAG: hypothetical protein CMF72_22650 [Mameliella sp.]|nr:hypothetical protein [Mameliella sp.]
MVNKQARSPGEIRRFEATGRVSADVPGFAADTGAAFRTLEAMGAQLSGTLFKLAGEAAGRAGEMAGLQSQQTGVAYLEARAAEAKGEAIASSGPWKEQAKALLRKEEGFRDNPYWDVNAHRVGYGSDTTIIDGKPVRVTRGMKITREQAEADLEYRLSSREGAQVQRQLGEVWDRLPDGARAGLASVGYNYGSLPGSVVKAARTGDLNAIADAVAALPANSKRREREAALIRGGGGQAQPAQMVIPTQPLALRRDGTIYGEAYDRAAMSAYAWRLDQGISNDLNAAHEEFRDDPAGFQQRVTEIRDTYLADDSFADPQAREVFEKSFATRAEAYARDVANRQGQRLDAEEKAATGEALDARINGIEKDAYLLGANPEGDRIIGEQIDRTMRSIDAAVASGSVTPAQAVTWRERIRKGAMQSRLHGVFDALETPDQKREFALGLMTDEKLLGDFGFADVRAISDLLFNRAISEGSRKTAADRIENARIESLIEDDLTSLQATGAGLDPAESGLSADLVSVRLGPEKLAAWQEARRKATLAYQATAGMETDSEAEILTRLDTLKPKPGQAGFAEQEAIFALAQKRAEQVIKERQQDPMGQAMRAGAVDVAPIDFSSGEALAGSLAARRQAARGVSDLYGTPRRFLMPGEQEKLAQQLEANPMLMETIASASVSALGQDAPAFLSEISQSAPVLSHAAGMASVTGDTSIAGDIATTLAAKRDKIYTAKMPQNGQMLMAAQGVLGTALTALPRTQSALLETATLLFEQAANREGFDTKEIDDPRTPAGKAWETALNRASGRRTLGGVDYGGFADVNGQRILVPPDMPADEPERLWDEIDDDLLSRLPPVESRNGVPLTARQIRRGRLVTAGDGTYRVALGDPSSANPQWLATPDGRFWEIDIRELARIEANR